MRLHGTIATSEDKARAGPEGSLRLHHQRASFWRTHRPKSHLKRAEVGNPCHWRSFSLLSTKLCGNRRKHSLRLALSQPAERCDFGSNVGAPASETDGKLLVIFQGAFA